MTTIRVAYDRRCWASFEVTDATPEEIEVLGDIDTPEALALAKSLEAAGRLTYTDEDQEDAPEYFTEYSSVIDCQEDN